MSIPVGTVDGLLCYLCRQRHGRLPGDVSRCVATEEISDAVRYLRHGGHRRDRVLQPRRGPRLRLGLGHRQPDDLLGLLRRAGPGRTADPPDPPRAGHGICGTRIPPVHVAAMATLNRLAPGRVHLGIGTGNTAMRTMGQRPMRIADYDEYLGVLAALLRGEVVDYRYRDRRRPIKMLTDNKKYMSLEPKI